MPGARLLQRLVRPRSPPAANSAGEFARSVQASPGSSRPTTPEQILNRIVSIVVSPVVASELLDGTLLDCDPTAREDPPSGDWYLAACHLETRRVSAARHLPSDVEVVPRS